MLSSKLCGGGKEDLIQLWRRQESNADEGLRARNGWRETESQFMGRQLRSDGEPGERKEFEIVMARRLVRSGACEKGGAIDLTSHYVGGSMFG